MVIDLIYAPREMFHSIVLLPVAMLICESLIKFIFKLPSLPFIIAMSQTY